MAEKAYHVCDDERRGPVLKARSPGHAKIIAINRGYWFRDDFLYLDARRVPTLDGMNGIEATDQEIYESGLMGIYCGIDHGITKEGIREDKLPEPKFDQRGTLVECPYCAEGK